MQRKALVLDANILIRATLGERVRRILEIHADSISFFLPEAAYEEAEEHLAALVVMRGGDPSKAKIALKAMAALATLVGDDLYRDFETESAEAAGRTRSGGLADSRSRSGSRVLDMDGRH
jgi:hypothetical protein